MPDLVVALVLLVGLGAALAAACVLSSMPFGIGAADPEPFGVSAALFGILSLAVSYVPVRRALVDPTTALRAE